MSGIPEQVSVNFARSNVGTLCRLQSGQRRVQHTFWLLMSPRPSKKERLPEWTLHTW